MSEYGEREWLEGLRYEDKCPPPEREVIAEALRSLNVPGLNEWLAADVIITALAIHAR